MQVVRDDPVLMPGGKKMQGSFFCQVEVQTRVRRVFPTPVPDPITPCRCTHTCTERDKEKSETKGARVFVREGERSL